MTDRELKPCPFCGSEDVRFPESIGEPPYNACRLCGSMALITKWNSRPIEDALRAENARLREALAKRDEPLTDEQADALETMAIKELLIAGERINVPKWWDAAIRRVRGES